MREIELKSIKIKGRKWFINVAHSFKEAQDWDDCYYASLSREERLTSIQVCRDNYFKTKGKNAGREGFRRFFKIVQQA